MAEELTGVWLKIDRAQKHLNEVTDMLSLLKHGECRMVSEHDKNSDLLVQRIHITPKPTSELSAVVGDVLFGIRSALDHLAWQLVIANGNVPDSNTMFPITSSIEAFGKSNRLRGVSPAALAIAESLQPYHTANKAMERLNTLHNMDKHRTLNLTTVVADNTSLTCYRDGFPVLDMFIGDEELRDGAVFGGVGVPLNSPELEAMFPNFRNTLTHVEVKGEATLFVAFAEAGTDLLENFEVELTLTKILKFVKETAIPSFSPLFTS